MKTTPIEFQAWSDKEERMVTWKELISPEGFNCTLGVLTNQKTHHLTFLQYTGRKDIYKKKIYKGDIVRWTGNYDPIGVLPSHIGIVEFQDASFFIKNDYISAYCWMDYEVEKLGNIFENTMEEYENK